MMNFLGVNSEMAGKRSAGSCLNPPPFYVVSGSKHVILGHFGSGKVNFGSF